MTRDEYVKSLAEALPFLNEEARGAALAFYTEMLDDRIEDGMEELAAVAAMEAPEAIAARLRAENGEPRETPPEEGEFDFSATLDAALRTAKSAMQAAAVQAQRAAARGAEMARKAAQKAEETARQAMENAAREAETAPDAAPAPDASEGYTPRVFTRPAGDVRAVRIEAMDMPVVVSPSADDQLTLTYYSCDRDEYRAELQEGVLCLRHVGRGGGWGLNFSFFSANMVKVLWNHNTPTIELTLPADALIDLSVETTNGSIRVRDMNALCDTALRTSNGRIALENIACKELSLKTSNGRIALENVSAKRALTGKTSNGRIEGRRLFSGGEMRLSSSNGRLTAEGAQARETMTLTTSNSAITVSGLEAPGLTLRSSNGPIRGTLPGRQEDWAIDSGTSNGHNSLPKHQEGGKPLSVHTSNSPIDITFAG